MHSVTFLAFSDELEKISVSQKWVEDRVTSAMKKGVEPTRYMRFADRLVAKGEKLFDKAQKSGNWKHVDNHDAALDRVQKLNPFDFPGGKGIK